MITLYTAPNCLRCSIVKAFLTAQGLEYTIVDFKAEAPVFNSFYRAQRTSIYRNAEGVEFPIYFDGTLRQGAGIILAHVLGQGALDLAVTPSKLLHGWISGLNLSLCPKDPDQTDNFVQVVRQLKTGGLKVCLTTDGRRPELLQQLMPYVDRCELKVVGDAEVYASLYGEALSTKDLAQSIALVTSSEYQIFYSLVALPRDKSSSWATVAEAKTAAKMIAEASPKQLPCYVTLPDPDLAIAANLEPLLESALFQYRTALREYLFKADILK